MRGPARGAGALLLCVATAAVAAMPAAEKFVADSEVARLDPSTFDFAAAGLWALDADQRRSWEWAMYGRLSNPDSRPDFVPTTFDPMGDCAPAAQRRLVAMAWALPALQATDEREWRSARAELLSTLGRLDRHIDAAASAVETRGHEPRVRELQRRFARDQAVRATLADGAWTAGLSPLASKSWFLLRGTRWVAIDCGNTAWLQEQLRDIGWFDIRKFGAEADNAAWHLVQHADRDPDFQRRVLELLQRLPKEATNQPRIAYLFDRVALAEGRPQRFGSQNRCLPDGGSELQPLEDPARLNERRAAAGLPAIDPARVKKDPRCEQPAQ